MQSIKFNPAIEHEFVADLKARVNNYFTSKHISRHANAEMYIKSVLGIFFWLGSWLLFMSNWFSPAQFMLIYVFHIFCHLFIAFNIAHDANHSAYSSRTKVNSMLAYVFDLVGVSSYMWRLMHNDSHHSFVNILGTDVSVESNGIFRFSPEQQRKTIHKYQHIYAPVLYCLSTLDWVLRKDFLWLWKKFPLANGKFLKHAPIDICKLVFFKAFYYSYTLVLPIILLDVAWFYVISAFLIGHVFIGFTMSAIFQSTHIVEGTVFPNPDEHGRMDTNYISHILHTTADYSWRNPIANWFWGCLNVHTIHHIFPRICHVHYPALTRIIMETAREHKLEYRENPTLTQAFISHLRILKQLGSAEEISLKNQLSVTG